MNFRLARIDEIDRLWPQMAAGFAKVCRRARNVTVAELYERVRAGGGFLLVAYDEKIRGGAICVAEQWADGPKINVMAFWGDGFAAWRDEFMDAVRRLGGLCGADTAIFSGPKAYRRIFPEAKVLRVIYEVK